MECDKRVPDPDWTPQPNGCSTPTGNNPAWLWCGEASSFLGACNTHDECYQTCGGTGGWGKYNCDCAFGADMIFVCNNVTGESCIYWCNFWKDVYVVTVDLVGDWAWEADQVAACACCDCD